MGHYAGAVRKWLFWRIDRLDDWTFDRSERVWQHVPWEALQRAACVLFGHLPISTCHDPDHDNCAFCRIAMPGQGDRHKPTGGGDSEVGVTGG